VELFRGRRGEYRIIEIKPPDKLVVEYVSGEWAGRTVTMSKELHDRIQYNIRMEEEARKRKIEEERALLLDIWWQLYPALYKAQWYEGITDRVLLERLEENYPEAAEVVHGKASMVPRF